jgi:hypothetical protein
MSCDGSGQHGNQAPAPKAGLKGTEMTNQITKRPTADISQRKVALIAGFSLLVRSAHFPRFLGVLVAIAGGGYLADSFARILIPDFAFTFSVFTFVGEALLIFWLFWRAIVGFPSESDPSESDPSESESPGAQVTEQRLPQPTTLAP